MGLCSNLDRALVRHVLIALGYILSWYFFSIGITFYNKWLFKVLSRE